MAPSREEKRAKFMAGRPRANHRKTWLTLAVVAMAVILGIVWYQGFLNSGKSSAGNEPGDDGTSGASYVEMTDIPTPAAAGGKLTLSLAEIKQKRLIRFVHGVNKTPVLAYATSSKRIVTAISMCEPCRSESFHIEGDGLVCNACGTRWTLEDLKGISGGCPEYPPERLENTISGDSVTISEQAVLNWRPRV